jgi:hypothetical protein
MAVFDVRTRQRYEQGSKKDRTSIGKIPDTTLDDGLLTDPGCSVGASSGDTQTPASCKA